MLKLLEFIFSKNDKLLTILMAHKKNMVLLQDFYALVNLKEEQTEYNAQTLPHYYRIMMMCCKHDPEYLPKWMDHSNWSWAVKNVFLNTLITLDCQLHDVIIELLTLGCTAYPEFRDKLIALVTSTPPKGPIGAVNTLRFGF